MPVCTAMDMIKMEPELNQSAAQTCVGTEVEDKKPFSEEENLLDLHMTGIKKEGMDCGYNVTSDIKFEETIMPNSFTLVKCESKKEACDLDLVKENVKLEVVTEEESESTAVHQDSSVSSETRNIAREELLMIEQNHKNFDNFEKLGRNAFLECSKYDKLYTGEDKSKTKSCSYRFDSSKHSDTSCSSMKCTICGKVFATSRAFKRHLRTHTCEKSFMCDVCGKFFVEMGNLNKHTLLHTGERPYKCDVCGQCFTQFGNLKKHAHLHTGEKPFKCNPCGKCFSQMDYLKTHTLLVHTGERQFKCIACGKCFLNKGSLKQHAKLHTGERPFKCDICGKCFTLKGCLKKHTFTYRREAI
ncbi:gastrula zinc finger protein XlCGF28.1-like [Periplaneta americana]|uniref:gastrula zinc finger protein XlCGF28.1-like n=1 Tax=Periplaneta americana TaxID=6978 RepID=UPI0037E90A77